MLYYTIYKITNLINNRIYIGQHITTNIKDNYLGSGKNIKSAIKKYGKSNFKKDILFVFNTFEEMNNKEIELVTESFISDPLSYNINPGGRTHKITEGQKCQISKTLTGRTLTKEHKENISKNQGVYERTEQHRKDISDRMTGNRISEETRNKLRNKVYTNEEKKHLSDVSKQSKYFKITENDKIIYEGKNLEKYARTINTSVGTLRKSANTGTPIAGKTYKTKFMKDWLVEWVIQP